MIASLLCFDVLHFQPIAATQKIFTCYAICPFNNRLWAHRTTSCRLQHLNGRSALSGTAQSLWRSTVYICILSFGMKVIYDALMWSSVQTVRSLEQHVILLMLLAHSSSFPTSERKIEYTEYIHLAGKIRFQDSSVCQLTKNWLGSVFFPFRMPFTKIYAWSCFLFFVFYFWKGIIQLQLFTTTDLLHICFSLNDSHTQVYKIIITES